MEVMEDGNLMDRVPILLQRDLEYYQKNQTVLSETVCRGVVGGRLDFPRTASYAAVKLVTWLEEEFTTAFGTGSGLFNNPKEEKAEGPSIVRSSDSDKFVSLTIQSADLLLEHLHVLVQEALDHADLPVLTATLGAAALVKNSLHCYVQMSEESGSLERNASLQACFKRYATMSEAVGERMLDLHVRLLSLYLLQDAGGQSIDNQDGGAPEVGSAPVQGWWLYMQGSKQDLWETVPPRMAQRIFAGMLNETLTILTVRYCQSDVSDGRTRLLTSDVVNVLLCCAALLPAVCGAGGDLLGVRRARQPRHVRDLHAKCDELYKCLVFRSADLHFIHRAFKEQPEEAPASADVDQPSPWFTLVSPHLVADGCPDATVTCTQQLSTKVAVALELKVLLGQPQPSWPLLVKVLMMRNCYLAGELLAHGVRNMSRDHARWRCDGLWFSAGGAPGRCGGFLCTLDGFCKSAATKTGGDEFSKAVGALTYIIVSIGSKHELRTTLLDALEVSGLDWAACLDRRQVWCDRRPSWLAAILATAGSTMQVIPAAVVNAVKTGATMYQAMSLCLSCTSRLLGCVPACLATAAATLQDALPAHVTPLGGSVLLQLLLTVLYEQFQIYAHVEAEKEKASTAEQNGEAFSHHNSNKPRGKHVRIAGMEQRTLSSSASVDGSAPSVALAAAEALCSIDEGDKHTQQIQQLLQQAGKPFAFSDQFGLEDFPELASFMEEGNMPGANAERENDASALTGQLMMSPAGRDSLRVMYEHLALHEERVYTELGVQERTHGDEPAVSASKAPLLYTMFHVGRQPFDQYLRGEWPVAWSGAVERARRCAGASGARAHVTRRADMRARTAAASAAQHGRPPASSSAAPLAPAAAAALADLHRIFSTPLKNVL